MTSATPPLPREHLEALPCRSQARHLRELMLDGIEDYQFIGGDRLSARQAAGRLGVSPRTIQRGRAFLREAGTP